MTLKLDVLPARTTAPRRAASPWKAAALVGVAVVVVMLGRLFIGGVVGMGDLGDGHRLMCTAGVADPHAFDPGGHLHTHWTPHRWYGETCGTEGPSTETWLIWPSKYLTTLFFAESGVDLRALGLLCSLLTGLLCGLLVLVLRGPVPVRAFLAAGVGMVFADCAFAGYFVSAYAEPAVLLGTVATLVPLLVVWRRGFTTLPTLLCAAGALLFTIVAKSQTAAYVFPIAIALLTMPYGGVLPLAGRGWYGRRWPALVVLGLTCALTTVYVGGHAIRDRDRDVDAMVFKEILPHSPSRAADAAALGLDPTRMNVTGSPGGPAAYSSEHVGWLRVGVFYGTHPTRFVRMFYRGVAATAQMRPANVGSYPAGVPYAQEHRLPFYTWVFAVFRWANWLMLSEWIMLALCGLLVLRHEFLPAWSRIYGHLALWLSAAIPALVWTEMLTEGAEDTARHLACASFLTAVGLPVLVVCSGLLCLSLRVSTTKPIRKAFL